MFPLPLFYYFEIGALIISVAVLYKFDTKPLRWFIPFLFIMVLTEFTARYLRKVLHEPNTWLYNITIPLEYIFYGFIIGSFCLTPILKKTIFRITGLLAAWWLINLFFLQGFTNLNTITLKAGSTCMIIISCLGLVDLFKDDEHVTLLANPLFWICVGVLFFNAGEFTYLFFFDTFLQKGWDKTAKLFGSINNKMIFILYSCISIAIVCRKIPTKRLLPQ